TTIQLDGPRPIFTVLVFNGRTIPAFGPVSTTSEGCAEGAGFSDGVTCRTEGRLASSDAALGRSYSRVTFSPSSTMLPGLSNQPLLTRCPLTNVPRLDWRSFTS